MYKHIPYTCTRTPLSCQMTSLTRELSPLQSMVASSDSRGLAGTLKEPSGTSSTEKVT